MFISSKLLWECFLSNDIIPKKGVLLIFCENTAETLIHKGTCVPRDTCNLTLSEMKRDIQMIHAVIQAGFGNQLFQYATAYTLSRDLKQDLQLDVSFYDMPGEVWTNNLKYLNLDNKNFWSREKEYESYKLMTRVKFLHKKKVDGITYPFICEDLSNCRQDQRSLFGNIGVKGAIIYGFWQNTCYFDKYLSELSKQFVPAYELDKSAIEMKKKIGSVESVGVHVRRGDFVKHGWDKDSDYYKKGLKWFRTMIPNARFFFVSDDVAWTFEQFGHNDDVIVIDMKTSTKDIDEFFLLSSCKHQLISESTFGWWAAYLNLNTNKIVLCPKEAVGQIFADSWVKI